MGGPSPYNRQASSSGEAPPPYPGPSRVGPGHGYGEGRGHYNRASNHPPNFVNLLALVIRLGPQLVVGGKNKGVAGPSPVVVMAKTDIAKWRCSPLDKKLELPITIHTRPTPPKYFLVLVSLFSLIYV